MNLGEIKSAVREIVVDLTSGFEAGLLRSIQRAQRDLEMKTFCPLQENRDYFMYSKLLTNSGPYYVDFSNFNGASYDFIRLLYDPFLLATPSLDVPVSVQHLTRLSASEAKEQQSIITSVVDVGDSVRGSPKYWAHYNNLIYFYPLPDENGPFSGGRYKINISFYHHLTPLAADTDTNWFTEHEECAEYMTFKAAEDGLRLLRDPLFATYRQLAMEAKMRAVRAYRRRNWSVDDHIDVKPGARIGSYRV